MRYEAIVIGVSAGGLGALKKILPALPASFPIPVTVVQHRDGRADDFLAEYLGKISSLPVKEVEDKEPVAPGCIYLAPGGYHLMMELDRTFSLSVDDRVNYSCPSIDVLFESAAAVFGGALIGIVLTGANSDGSQGLKTIKSRGGLVIVQDPEDAESRAMPQAAMAAALPDHVIGIEQLAPLLVQLNSQEKGDLHGAAR